MKKRNKLLFEGMALVGALGSTIAPASSAFAADLHIENGDYYEHQTGDKMPSNDTPAQPQVPSDNTNNNANNNANNNTNNNSGNNNWVNPTPNTPEQPVKPSTPDNEAKPSDDKKDDDSSSVAPIATPEMNMSQEEFLNKIGPMAQRVAKKYNLYASVMLAQAIIESAWGGSSLSVAPNFNLFGMKGEYKGQSVSFATKEFSKDKGWYTINDSFRKYPGYEESFEDNGDKLRNGLEGNKEFYKGTWKENTKSYKDATKWLQGRYATAPNYASSLNAVIEAYDLTKYDADPDSDAPVSIDKVVAVAAAKRAEVYSEPKIDKLANVKIRKQDKWSTDQYVDSKDGHRFYRIGDSKYVLSSDVKLINHKKNKPALNKLSGLLIVKDNFKASVYRLNGDKMNAVPGKTLDSSSAWATDKNVTLRKDGKKVYYRISKDEWLLLSDLQYEAK